MQRFTRLRSFGVAAITALSFACVSPTIPLPPPEVPAVSAAHTPGYVHLTGGVGSARGNAIIVVYNRNPAVPLDKRVGGGQARSDGSWSCDVLAASGDVLDVSQDVLGERSDSVIVEVRLP